MAYAEHQPLVPHAFAGSEHGILVRGQPEGGADVLLFGGRKGVDAPERVDEELELPELSQQDLRPVAGRPAAPGEGDAVQGTQAGGDAGKLGVHHARRRFLGPAAVVLKLVEAVAHDVAHPALQIVQSGGHASEAGGFASGCGGGIGGLALFLFFFLPGGAFLAGVQPLLHPVRGFAARERGLVREAQQEQGQRVLAGKFAARATAFEGRAGEFDLDLIRLRAAALAFAPHHRVVEAEGGPFAGRNQPARRLDRRIVRRKGQYGFSGKFHRLSWLLAVGEREARRETRDAAGSPSGLFSSLRLLT